MTKINYDVHLNFYMRIHYFESEAGSSIFYIKQTMKHCQNFDTSKIETLAQHAIENAGNLFEVSPDKIDLITFQEYQKESGDEEEEDV